MSDPGHPAARSSVLLVGAGYGALKVAQDLAQSGIPVTWVTRGHHFLQLPGGIERFEEWPEDLNFQFRPLYLRVTRHPLVKTLTRSRIESLERGPSGFRAVVVQAPRFIAYDLCTGCGRCIEVCPLKDSAKVVDETKSRISLKESSLTPRLRSFTWPNRARTPVRAS